MISARMTVKLQPGENGNEIVLVSDDGVVQTEGHVTPSQSEPGYITIIPHKILMMKTLRVPIDWMVALENAKREAESS